jgi:hypothetical protein
VLDRDLTRALPGGDLVDDGLNLWLDQWMALLTGLRGTA